MQPSRALRQFLHNYDSHAIFEVRNKEYNGSTVIFKINSFKPEINHTTLPFTLFIILFFIQVVSTSDTCIFDLSAIAIPSGTINHGVKELNETGQLFGNIDFVVVSLGTNDIFQNKNSFNRHFANDLRNIITTCNLLYPRAKVSLMVSVSIKVTKIAIFGVSNQVKKMFHTGSVS